MYLRRLTKLCRRFVYTSVLWPLTLRFRIYGRAFSFFFYIYLSYVNIQSSTVRPRLLDRTFSFCGRYPLEPCGSNIILCYLELLVISSYACQRGFCCFQSRLTRRSLTQLSMSCTSLRGQIHTTRPYIAIRND